MSDDSDPAGPGESAGGPRKQVRVPVHGMTCNGCAATVRAGLAQVAGVADVQVHLDAAEAVVTGGAAPPDERALREQVEALGYHLEGEAGPPRSRGKLVAAVAAAAIVVVAGLAVFLQVSGEIDVAGGAAQLQATFAEVSAVAFGLAFVLGIVVAFAPSSLAMTPAVIGYVTGSHTRSTAGALRLALAFVVGVLVVDAAIGAAAALGGRAAIAALEQRLALWFALMVVALVALALVNLGVWRPRLPSYIPRLRQGHGGGTVGAFLAGVPFGLLACPTCTPLLLPVLFGAVATGDPIYGAGLVAAFGVGRGLPLVAVGVVAGAAHTARSLSRWVAPVEKIVGVLLLLGAAYFLVLLVLAWWFPYEPQGFLALADPSVGLGRVLPAG